MLGVTLADAIYISLAAVGIVPLVQKIKATDKVFKSISGGFLIVLGVFFISMMWDDAKTVHIAEWLGKNIFLGLFLLTMMNPATIVVFTGIFTAELVERKPKAKELFLFASGVILTTPVFLGLVSILGTVSNNFLPQIAIKSLNLAVGLVLIYWGLTYFVPRFKFKKN